MRKYHHMGISTTTPLEGEYYLENYKVHVADFEPNEFGIELMRFDDDYPLPELVKNVPHLAFEVDDLEEELKGKQIVIAPNSPSEGVIVAFIVENGAPVEFLQYLK